MSWLVARVEWSHGHSSCYLTPPAGLAIKGALIAAFLDFAFGVSAAIRDGTFAWMPWQHSSESTSWDVCCQCHSGNRRSTTQATRSMIAAAAVALTAYTAETLASIYSSISDATADRKVANTNPIPQD